MSGAYPGQAQAGWYPVSDSQERYWDGATWTDEYREAWRPVATTSAPGTYGVEGPWAKPKKKRRIFWWFFLAVQILFLIWIITGLAGSAGHPEDCGSLSQQTCADAQNVGTGIAVFLIIMLWMAVDFFLGLGYLIYRLAKR